MDAGIKETKEQALKEMELFKTVFDGVRLLNMHALELIGKGLGSYSLTESEQKFDFWEKEHPCDNDSCIVLQALRDKDVHTKLIYRISVVRSDRTLYGSRRRTICSGTCQTDG